MSDGRTRRAIIALGGNLGDRLATMHAAMRAIDDLDGVDLEAASSVYESAAITLDGVDEQAPRYLNAVVAVRTARDPRELLAMLFDLERRFGRERSVRWGSRTLDLDLIDVEGVECASELLTLPHPRAWQRAFVLAPWHEIEPDAQLAGRGPIADLLSAATDRVDLFAQSVLGSRSPGRVSTDRGLPLLGPDSQAARGPEPRPGPGAGGTST